MPIRLRAADPADSLALADILQSAETANQSPEQKTPHVRRASPISASTLEALYVIVAERNGVPLAFAGLRETGFDGINIAFLHVLPNEQRKGLGSLLLRRMEDQARFRKRQRITIEAEGRAAAFFKNRGFCEAPAHEGKQILDGYHRHLRKDLPAAVQTLSSLNIQRSARPWAFETANLDAINAHFEAAKRKIPQLWNGRTLKLTGYSFEDGAFQGVCSECSFASFLAWRDWGAPDASAHNMFGSAVLRSSDNALLYGVMAPHTASAGMIYPPGGNLDPADVTEDGKVDIVAAIFRELTEETGLTSADVDAGELLVAFDGPRIAIAQVLDVETPAEALRDHIIRFSAASEEQELSDVRIIHSTDDLADPAIVSFARAIGEHLLT